MFERFDFGLFWLRYCLNNPLIYTAPDGDFAILTFIIDAIKTIANGGLDVTSWEIMKKAWAKFDPTKDGTKTNNALKLDAGLFLSQHATWLHWDKSSAGGEWFL